MPNCTARARQRGVNIASGYEDLRFSAAMAHIMERAGIGFDVAAHQAWINRKQEPVAAIEAHLAALDPALTPACIASGVQLDRLFRQRLCPSPAKEQRQALLAWPKTEKARRLSFGREDLAAVLTADRLPGAERQLVEGALYASRAGARPGDVRCGVLQPRHRRAAAWSIACRRCGHRALHQHRPQFAEHPDRVGIPRLLSRSRRSRPGRRRLFPARAARVRGALRRRQDDRRFRGRLGLSRPDHAASRGAPGGKPRRSISASSSAWG